VGLINAELGGLSQLFLKVNMLEIITTIPYGSNFFPVHFSKVFHQYSTIRRYQSLCSVTNSSPSPLLVNNTSVNGKVAGSMNPETTSATSSKKKKKKETTSATSRGVLEDALLKFPNNTVGVIGGVSTGCTLHFLNKLVELSSQDGSEVIPFIVCKDTIPGIKNLCESRSQRKLIVDKLRENRVFLEKCGAHCIVMPCHNLQVWHGDIGTGSSVPFLHIGDCVLKELKAAKLNPIEGGGNVRIGLLSSGSSLSTRFYQEILQNEVRNILYFSQVQVIRHYSIKMTFCICFVV
jgi:aspartate/glutamate racemase